jgi:RNA polymerase sigma factor (sigma-70 family)
LVVSISTRPGGSLEPVPLELVEAYAVHRAEVRALLLRLTRDPDAADDMTQEAFARLARQTAEGRAPTRTRAWLYRVAVNLAHDRGRRASRAERGRCHLVAGYDDRAPAEDDPVRCLLAREERDAMSRVMAGLPRDAREALVMAASGYTRREIGHRIGRSDLAVRALLCRSRRRVRLALGGPA